MNKIIAIAMSAALMTGCTSAATHRADVQDDSMDRVTVGTVQKEIYIGMSGGEVASILGSPNIVSTDANRDEVWIYDKFATDAAYSKSRTGGVGFKTHESGADSRSQRTLTVVIKFDADKHVRDFAYHTARF